MDRLPTEEEYETYARVAATFGASKEEGKDEDYFRTYARGAMTGYSSGGSLPASVASEVSSSGHTRKGSVVTDYQPCTVNDDGTFTVRWTQATTNSTEEDVPYNDCCESTAPTAKSLRKQAKHLEKQERRQKAEMKAHARLVLREDRERALAYKTLRKVARGEGYATAALRDQAAKALLAAHGA